MTDSFVSSIVRTKTHIKFLILTAVTTLSMATLFTGQALAGGKLEVRCSAGGSVLVRTIPGNWFRVDPCKSQLGVMAFRTFQGQKALYYDTGTSKYYYCYSGTYCVPRGGAIVISIYKQ
jgi:hypothetical protein